MLFGETVAVYCENRTEHTDTLCGEMKFFKWYIQSVPFILISWNNFYLA
jgi:hypothetical protein